MPRTPSFPRSHQPHAPRSHHPTPTGQLSPDEETPCLSPQSASFPSLPLPFSASARPPSRAAARLHLHPHTHTRAPPHSASPLRPLPPRPRATNVRSKAKAQLDLGPKYGKPDQLQAPLQTEGQIASAAPPALAKPHHHTFAKTRAKTSPPSLSSRRQIKPHTPRNRKTPAESDTTTPTVAPAIPGPHPHERAKSSPPPSQK
ncbi:hypothetical protein B0H13DRAFT_2381850 [Mycena leptocephala]|nr:hypothetical protein B0H13DRAFT_2381850 [Mycena leptocephala]